MLFSFKIEQVIWGCLFLFFVCVGECVWGGVCVLKMETQSYIPSSRIVSFCCVISHTKNERLKLATFNFLLVLMFLYNGLNV